MEVITQTGDMHIIVDESIILDMIRPEHAERLFELSRSNKEELEAWFPWVHRMHTISHFKNFSMDSAGRYAAGTEVPLVIVYEGQLCGRIGIYNIDQQNQHASIGYWLGSEFQGKGIVTKACKKLITYGFKTLRLNRIEIKCGTTNIRSQGIPKKLNFTREGIARQAEFVNNRFIDIVVYSMLKNEWQG